MPKRIPNLGETIVAEAARLFSQLGYDAVDMKQVAAEAGTSVGNLYNYFPSKPALFLAIVQNWRTELLEACRAILATDLPARSKVLGVMERLYNDIASWHGLWMEFLSGREERHQVMEDKAKGKGGPLWGLGIGLEEGGLTEALETLITGLPAGDPPYRWSTLVITATLQMAARYPQDRAENWKFLESLVDKI